MTDQALSGVRVLDLTHYIAGPYCTRILADFGAEVIKIEKPGEGDAARRMPPFLNDEPGQERSGLFLYLNNNKKGTTLNLKSNMGIKIFRELVKDADVVIENFSPGVMDRLGLDYQTLEKTNPRLVMTSISNFGQTGPYRDYKSSHLIAWMMSGMRYNDGAPGEKPVQIGGWLSHYLAGIHAVVGTAIALYQRNENGVGQYVDVSMLESVILATCYPTTVFSYLGVVHNSISKERFGLIPCQDGYIGLNLFGRLNWEMMCSFLGMPELSEDTRFETPSLRAEHYEELRAAIAERVKDRKQMDLFLSGVEWRLPIGLVPTTKEILDSPQHRARGFFEEVNHPVMGKVTMPGAPFKMTESPWQLRRPAPLLGEHNQEIYGDRLGYTGDDLVRLRAQGVI